MNNYIFWFRWNIFLTFIRFKFKIYHIFFRCLSLSFSFSHFFLANHFSRLPHAYSKTSSSLANEKRRIIITQITALHYGSCFTRRYTNEKAYCICSVACERVFVQDSVRERTVEWKLQVKSWWKRCFLFKSVARRINDLLWFITSNLFYVYKMCGKSSIFPRFMHGTWHIDDYQKTLEWNFSKDFLMKFSHVKNIRMFNTLNEIHENFEKVSCYLMFKIGIKG